MGVRAVGGGEGAIYQSLSSAGRGVMMCVSIVPQREGVCVYRYAEGCACLAVRKGLWLSSST